MVFVYEGFLSSTPSDSGSDLILTPEGHLYNDSHCLKTPNKFYFLELSDGIMWKVCPKTKYPLQKVLHKTRLDDYHSGKMYLKIGSEWIGLDVPKDPLPEISIVQIHSDQLYYYLNLPPKSLALPLKSSHFQDLTSGKISVQNLTEPQTLAYLLIEFEEHHGQNYQLDVRVVYQLLTPTPPIYRPLDRASSSLTLGTPSNRIYFADQRGDLVYRFMGVTKLCQYKGTQELVLISQKPFSSDEGQGLELTFRHRVEDVPGLPCDTEKWPRNKYEQINIYKIRKNSIFRAQRLVHREDFSEILELIGTDDHHSVVHQSVLIEYGSLWDKQVLVEIEVSSDQFVDGKIDLTEDFQDQLSDIVLNKDLHIYYLTHPRGFDIKSGPRRVVLKTFREPPKNEPFLMIRKVMVQGCLRPILLIVRVHPSDNS